MTIRQEDVTTVGVHRTPRLRATLGRGAVAALLAAAVIWYGSLRTSCGPAAGTVLEGNALTKPALDWPSARSGPSREPAIVQAIHTVCEGATRLRIGTFNIHGGKGTDGVRDLERTADCLSGLDLAGINEAHGAFFLESMDQAEVLGRKLGCQWLFAPTEERWWHYLFGNGVLTTLDVDYWQRIPLPREHGKSFRNILLVGVDVGDRRLNVVITHLDRSDDRERVEQLRLVGDFFLSLAEPAILMGDMNTGYDDPAMQRLLAARGVVDPVGDALGANTPPRIDWILLRGLRAVDAGLVNTVTSDHPFVWAEVELID